MSRTLSTYVSIWGESGQLVTLTPGDELPEWAEGRVGEHCLVPDESADTSTEEESADTEPEPAEEQDADEEKDAQADEVDGEEPTAATDDAPDFTAPAPARRNSRSRK